MRKPVNPSNNPDQSLNICNDKSPLEYPANIDPPQSYCDPASETQKKIPGGDELFGLLEKSQMKKTGIGQSALCDPMQTGQIVNDVPEGTNRNTIYRYSKALRGCDEAVKDLFNNVVVIDEDGKYFPVPIIWGTQERAVAYILQDNMRKDNSAVVDRIRLPMMSIHSESMEFNQSRFTYHMAMDYGRGLNPDFKPGYTIKEKYEKDTVFGVTRGIPIDVGYNLYVWTMYLEDMNQIIEQVITKFSPIAYIRVRGVNWEVGVKLNSISNNLNVEPGDKAHRVIKYQFSLTAETYVPQPVARKKAVLKTKIDIFNKTEEKNVSEVINRLEEAVEELE